MEALRQKLGALFRIRWYRIILDEAHAIKRHDSSSKFCLRNAYVISNAIQLLVLAGNCEQSIDG